MIRFKYIIILLLLLAGNHSGWATHNRAGEITYESLGNFTFLFTVVTYTYTLSPVNQNRDSLPINWGYGNLVQKILRDSIKLLDNDVTYNRYRAQHTFPGPGRYTISMEDPNRNVSVMNMPNSGSTPFYIFAKLIIIDPNVYGFNNSPELLQPPIDLANKGELYTHFPTASDPDGDSLRFSLVPCKGQGGFDIPGYRFPGEIAGNDSLTIDPLTGELIWDVPGVPGEYNIAILIEEYNSFGVLMGCLIRDMQIEVLDNNNRPPIVIAERTICVIAGEILEDSIYSSDPDPGDEVALTAAGGPLQFATNPATFVSNPSSPFLVNSPTGYFRWQTSCEHVRKQFYQVVFKAEDNYVEGIEPKHLSDMEAWTIFVIAPPPENIAALPSPTGDRIELTWKNPYSCESNTNFKEFSLWRRIGSNPFVPDSCETGLTGRGYVKIADRLKQHYFIDSMVSKGALYCYRLLAHFRDLAVSMPSEEVCVELPKNAPIITHVDVGTTDPNIGEINVAWVHPDPEALDTLLNGGSYKYVLRRNGIPIDSFIAASFYQLADTSYIDNTLNTEDAPLEYDIRFYVNDTEFLDQSSAANSLFTSVTASDRRLTLSYEPDVPWFNEQYFIYRAETFAGPYLFIDTTPGTSYADKGLINGKEYCYYVRSVGTYGSSPLDSLSNRSQIICGVPLDSVPPCPPDLSLRNNCQFDPEIKWSQTSYQNELVWTNLDQACSYDIMRYDVYYTPEKQQSFTLIATLNSPTDTEYVHTGLQSLAGCYAIVAVDSVGNKSALDSVCIDNCPFYELPNVFTPNKDGIHDFFTPIYPYRFVERIEIRIYNRWGQLVFKTENPDILWDGNSGKKGKKAKEGVYFYTCDIFTKRLNGLEQIRLPGGFIHLIR